LTKKLAGDRERRPNEKGILNMLHMIIGLMLGNISLLASTGVSCEFRIRRLSRK
jgi:hypothetical protein